MWFIDGDLARRVFRKNQLAKYTFYRIAIEDDT